MFLTADALLAHAVGDYLLQSDYMALEKTKSSVAAAVHATTYTLPFLALTLSPSALVFIAFTHFIIDRWRLARFVVWTKNLLGPARYRFRWEECAATGYHRDRPAWLATWLLIIADNIMHVALNAVALRLL